MLSGKQLKALHGKEYVNQFEKGHTNFRLNKLLKFVELTKECKIVDFACGNGMLLPLIANNICAYTGVDFSEEFIQAAEKKKQQHNISNANFICTDIENFCSKNMNIFDVAFALDFSEHVYNDAWIEILKSIRQSLKPTGKLYLHTPNSLFFIEKMKAKNFILQQFPEHIAVRSPEENRELLMKAGFMVTKIKLLPHYNILRTLHPISYIPFIGKWFKARIFIEAIPTNNFIS